MESNLQKMFYKSDRHRAVTFLNYIAMKKYLFLFLISIIITSSGALAQKPVRVTYKTIVNGREMPGGSRMTIESDGATVRLITSMRQAGREQIPSPVQSSYIDLAGKRYIQLADMPDGTRMSTVMPFAELPVAEVTGETETIAGYRCVKSKLTYFSNSIEIW